MRLQHLPLIATLLAGTAAAQVIAIFPERQQERKSSRWSLTEWMKTKKEIAFQNMWLDHHTNKVPLDFTYGYDLKPGRQAHEADLYLIALGLHARYERGISLKQGQMSDHLNENNKAGDVALNWRLFGGNVQNTNLIVRGGYEYEHYYGLGALSGAYGGYYVAPELQIYLAPWLGLRGEWRHRFSSKRITSSGAHGSGRSWFTVAFLEINALRFEVGWQERERTFKSDTETLEFPDKTLVGRVRLFF